MRETEILILRKTPWRESSLIISGLSPDEGRLDFSVRGARQLGKKSLPAIDLFRIVQVHYHASERAMPSLHKVELLRDNDILAGKADAYLAACDIAVFLLRNSQPGIAAKLLYQSACRALATLSGEPGPKWLALVQLAFLSEHGLLAQSSQRNPGEEMIEKLLDAIENNRQLPALNQDYWQNLADWTNRICLHHGSDN